MYRAANVLFAVFLMLQLSGSVSASPRSRKDYKERARSTTWMREAKYGVFFHYLPSGPDYQKAIDSFDVQAFADQMVEAGAGYVYITLGQNSGYYCSPNKTYEKYLGCKPFEHCSKRDLPMELSKALSKRHIPMLLYLPSRAPQRDAAAMAALHDVNEQLPAPQEFTHRWGEVIKEWSLRYKGRVCGWWFDGSYNTAGWDDLSKPYSWTTWAAAARAGNRDSLLAFNPGTDLKKAFTALCSEQDYAAGEQNDWTADPISYPAPKGVQWQVLTFLGSMWSTTDGPKSTDAEVISAIKRINSAGGAVTMDVHVFDNGQVYGPALKQLIAVKKAIR